MGPIVNGEAFGFRSASALSRLGDRLIEVDVHLGPFPSLKRLIPLTLMERRAVVRDHFRRLYGSLVRSMHVRDLRKTSGGMSFTCTVPARALITLARRPGVGSIWVRRVPGRRKRVSPNKELGWYAVKARFAVQIENRTKGMQSYEERIVLVKAKGVDDALRRLRPEFREYGQVYLGGRWELVRWKFEEVVDTYALNEIEIDGKGTEVFSSLGSRRLRPQWVWHRDKGSGHV